MKIYTGSTKQNLMTALKHAKNIPLMDEIIEGNKLSQPDDMEYFKKKLEEKIWNNKNRLGSHIEITPEEVAELVDCLYYIKKYATFAHKILDKKTKKNTIDDVKVDE